MKNTVMKNSVMQHTASIIGTAKTGRRGGLIFVSILSLLWIAIPALGGEIHFAEVEGDGLQVDLALTSAPSGPSSYWQVDLLGGIGELVDSVQIPASAGLSATTVVLDLDLGALPLRGRQHTLELIDPTGAVVDRKELRIGFDCLQPDQCSLSARFGVRLQQGVELSAALAEALRNAEAAPGTVVDLEHLADLDPADRGPVLDLALDLAVELAAGSKACQCFYTLEDSYLDSMGAVGPNIVHAAGRSEGNPPTFQYTGQQVSTGPSSISISDSGYREATVDFFCAKVSAAVSTQINVGQSWVEVPLGSLTMCADQCPSPVSWSLEDHALDVILESDGFSSVAGEYSMSWQIDGVEVVGDDGSWSVSGTLMAPLTAGGVTHFVNGASVPGTPTHSRLEGNNYVGFFGWGASDQPQGQVSSEATVRAEGEATCASGMEFLALPDWDMGPEPSTIILVAGPIDP